MPSRVLLQLTGTAALFAFAAVAAPIPTDDGAAVRQADRVRTIDLRPKFVVGREARYTMKIDSSLSTQVNAPDLPGEPAQTSVNQELDLRVVCTAATEAGGIIDLYFDRFKLNMAEGDMEAEFDSSTPAAQDAENPAARVVRPLVGAKLTLHLDHDGNITKIDGGAELARLSSSFGRELADPARARALFGPIFTAQKAPGSAKLGQSWTTSDTTDLAPFGSLTFRTTTTLDRFKAPDAELSIAGEMTLAPEQAGKSKLKTSTYEGALTWDSDAGLPRSLRTKQSLALEFKSDSVVQTVENSVTMTFTRTGLSTSTTPDSSEPALAPPGSSAP